MTGLGRIFVIPWNDDPARSSSAAQALYPDHQVVVIDKRTLRESSFVQQVRTLRGLQGHALVLVFRSLSDLNTPLLLPFIGLLHRCKVTIVVDENGNKTYGRLSWFRVAPQALYAILSDVWVLLFSFFRLKLALRDHTLPVCPEGARDGRHLAYLFPHPMLRPGVGGAMSHVRGFLGGLKLAGIECRIFSACSLPQSFFPQDRIHASGRPSLFWEIMALNYNWRFAAQVGRDLKTLKPVALYHRHGRFAFSGALLSRKLGVPLILEYNGSEVWVEQNWDPARFRVCLRLCEEYSLRSAALIVVVSQPLRKELIGRGVPAERILINPNAVDPEMFRPGCGGQQVRAELGIAKDELVVCFVGTFSYWHGISVLEQAAERLLEMAVQQAMRPAMRFLLIGDGPLRAEVEAHLQPWAKGGAVVFTGPIPHDEVARYLDAADIFVSPHTPLRDGTEFFGSPTKIFEYMAMGKAIVASRLGQMEDVFTHGVNGWLVSPGSPEELGAAVLYLATHPEICASLGRRAREEVMARHTWKRNAQAVWNAIFTAEPAEETATQAETPTASTGVVSAGR